MAKLIRTTGFRWVIRHGEAIFSKQTKVLQQLWLSDEVDEDGKRKEVWLDVPTVEEGS